MKTCHSTLKTIAAVLVCAIWFSTKAPTADAQWAPVMNECPKWGVEFMGKIYDRPTDDLGLGLVFDTVTNETLLTSDQAVDLNGAGGAEVRFNFRGHHFGHNWQLRTFLVSWDEQQDVTGDNLFTPLFPDLDPNSVFVDYDSEIFSIELMKRRVVRPGFTASFGPRFVSLREEFTTGFTQQLTFPLPFVIEGQQTIQARNQMYGLQGGLDLNFPIFQRFSLNGFARLGGYANPTRVSTTTSDNFSGITTTTEQTLSTGTFIGEIGGRLVGHVIPGRVNWFVGYEATWIDGVALGSAQFLVANGTGAIDTENTPFFHALMFGFGYNY